MKSNQTSPDCVPRPIVIGTGLVALDVVFGPNGGESLGRWAGGTCGNVLTILSFLGWTSYPVARLADDEPAQILRQDLASWGVRLEYVSQEAFGSTPIIVQYIRRDDRGEFIHKFSFKCPVCGHHLPGFRPVPSRDAKRLLEEMPTPEVFFFDRCSRSAIDLAACFRARGAIVLFEPSSSGDAKLFKEALRLAHIVKYAQERWSGKEVFNQIDGTWLLIETQGKDGLKFSSRLPSYRSDGWEHIPSFPVKHHKDAAGSGDWCTAGLIASLSGLGAQGLARLGEAEVRRALLRGQALAAWNCGFEGARGGMYTSHKDSMEDLMRAISPELSELRLESRKTSQMRRNRTNGPLTSCCDAKSFGHLHRRSR